MGRPRHLRGSSAQTFPDSAARMTLNFRQAGQRLQTSPLPLVSVFADADVNKLRAKSC